MTDLEAKLIGCLRSALEDAPGWRDEAQAFAATSGEWACHVDLFEGDPDTCVIDEGHPSSCVYAERCGTKEKCSWWGPKTAENLLRARNGDEPIR